ncbi:MAG: hypothetical protein AAGC45_07940 [Bacteroidota bacterium]
MSEIEEEYLYFCRSDIIGDDHEGTLGGGDQLLSPAVGGRSQKDYYYTKRIRELTFLNCWHLNEHEDIGMWERYVGEDYGIAVVSNVGRLQEWFGNIGEFDLGSIAYVDFEKLITMFSGNSDIDRFFYKRQEFSSENEYRILHQLRPLKIYPDNPDMKIFDWEFDQKEEGLRFSIDQEQLITKIVLAPNITKKHEDQIRHLLWEKSIEHLLQRSSLDRKPYL